MFQYSGIGILAFVAVTLCWSLSLVLYRVGGSGGTARKLALLLSVEGITLISTGYIDLFLTEAARAHHLYPAFYRFEEIVHTLGDCAMLALYPPFLAAALNSRMTRPFEGRRMQVFLWVAAMALFFAVLYTPLRYGATLLYLTLSVLFLFALIASIQAWHGADRGAVRTRAGIRAIPGC
jgi:hypothetical protein